MREKVVVSWSSGKDSAMALERILEGDFEVVALVSTLREDDRVSVHGVNRQLLSEQCRLLGLPLQELRIGGDVSYEAGVSKALKGYRDQGVKSVVYGDLYLDDIRKWRNSFHQGFGMRCLYPIWGEETGTLAERFIYSGFKAIVVCVDTKRLGIEFAGREFDNAFLMDLPEDVDPCGENGEFHTFVYDGPLFSNPVAFEKSPVVVRVFEDPGHSFEFGFCDLRPVSNAKSPR